MRVAYDKSTIKRDDVESLPPDHAAASYLPRAREYLVIIEVNSVANFDDLFS